MIEKYTTGMHRQIIHLYETYGPDIYVARPEKAAKVDASAKSP